MAVISGVTTMMISLAACKNIIVCGEIPAAVSIKSRSTICSSSTNRLAKVSTSCRLKSANSISPDPPEISCSPNGVSIIIPSISVWPCSKSSMLYCGWTFSNRWILPSPISASKTTTRCPIRAKWHPILLVITDFPVPPFPLAMQITRAVRSVVSLG